MAGEDPNRFEMGKPAPEPAFPESATTQPPAPTAARVGLDAALEPDPPTTNGGARIGEADERGVRNLGAALAEALEEGGYHPVVLFGTSASGKTSLLLSLLAFLKSRPDLDTGLFLCPSLLGAGNAYGQTIHADARALFEVLTQAFIRGEKIPATRSLLPFFVPVEIRPKNRVAVRFAFLESDGEWYRPDTKDGETLAGKRTLFKEWRREIEEFVSAYREPITFIYLAPYTQIDGDADRVVDREQVASAGLAIEGVVQAYDQVRGDQRHSDRHLLLVTKWDARQTKVPLGSEVLDEDLDALEDLLNGRYNQAYAAFKNLPGHCFRNAYSSGVIGRSGLRQPRDEDEAEAIATYPYKLWNWLYGNASIARGEAAAELFPQPPKPPALIRFWTRLLDYLAGR